MFCPQKVEKIGYNSRFNTECNREGLYKFTVYSTGVSSLSEVQLLQFEAPNLCDFDPGLEAWSRKAIISNLVISIVP